jgi:hypothetical protein
VNSLITCRHRGALADDELWTQQMKRRTNGFLVDQAYDDFHAGFASPRKSFGSKPACSWDARQARWPDDAGDLVVARLKQMLGWQASLHAMHSIFLPQRSGLVLNEMIANHVTDCQRTIPIPLSVGPFGQVLRAVICSGKLQNVQSYLCPWRDGYVAGTGLATDVPLLTPVLFRFSCEVRGAKFLLSYCENEVVHVRFSQIALCPAR